MTGLFVEIGALLRGILFLHRVVLDGVLLAGELNDLLTVGVGFVDRLCEGGDCVLGDGCRDPVGSLDLG